MTVTEFHSIDDFAAEPNNRRLRGPLFRWRDVVRGAAWRHFGDVRAMFNTADVVGECVVFNVAGNHGRLVARIDYAAQEVAVLRIMWHDEYDSGRWKTDCGCL